MARQKDSFVSYVNRKYCRELGKKARTSLFREWDDYAMWLYYDKAKESEEKYYKFLETDLIEYSEMQDENQKLKK